MLDVTVKIEAPWDHDIVERLNAVQKCGWIHPFTCGSCREDLVATEAGWICEAIKKGGAKCDYTQNWALSPPTLEDLEKMNPSNIFKLLAGRKLASDGNVPALQGDQLGSTDPETPN